MLDFYKLFYRDYKACTDLHIFIYIMYYLISWLPTFSVNLYNKMITKYSSNKSPYMCINE